MTPAAAPASARARVHAVVLRGGEAGQALLLVVGVLLAIVAATLGLGAVAAALTRSADDQRAADLAALAAARAMGAAYPRVFGPSGVGAASPGDGGLSVPAYLALATDAATATAERNGADRVAVSFPDARDALAPLHVVVRVAGHVRAPQGPELATAAQAEAELVPGAAGGEPPPGAGEYPGPFAVRQGQRMRPDVAIAFDRLEAAARGAGHALTITSAFRSDAEQAALFAAHPDPTWVARPGTSRHRLGTELDLGPASAYAWLLANAGRFHFLRRYPWEPWHFGYTLNAASRPAAATGSAAAASGGGTERGGGGLPAFVPARYAPMIGRAAQRWNVAGALLAAQIYAESRFDPGAVSGAGAQGIAQFMPATAASLGLRDPFDPGRAIDAQGHLMRDLLRQFGAVDLALAAYNAGPGAVQGCGCVPAYPETQRYVAEILALMRGAGAAVLGGELTVRLVA